MTLLRTDDAELYYELHGDGPPLVLIHGASGTHLAWWQQVAELRHHFSCLIYDLRGYGRSRALAELDPADGEAHVRDLAALIDHTGLGREPLNLMGASLGSAPALRFAADHPDRIARLLLCCGPGCVSTPRIDQGWAERIARMQARYRNDKGKPLRPSRLSIPSPENTEESLCGSAVTPVMPSKFDTRSRNSERSSSEPRSADTRARKPSVPPEEHASATRRYPERPVASTRASAALVTTAMTSPPARRSSGKPRARPSGVKSLAQREAFFLEERRTRQRARRRPPPPSSESPE
jgi:pimeloyl-ACP methyl ester carboxylesterase